MTEQKTNLNTASARELTLLPGIGQALAERIVEYRTTVGPFDEAGQITAVPGVGEATYRSIADRLTVGPPEEGSAPADEGSGEAPGEDEGPPEAAAVGAQAEPPVESALEGEPDLPEPEPEEPAAESRGTTPEATPEHPEEGEKPTAEPEGVTTEGLAEEPPREPAEIPTPFEDYQPAPPPSVWSQLSWLWTALLGGVLGMVFALVVFAGINGSLDIASSRAVLNVEGRVDGLAADVDSLQGEVNGLQRRVAALEGLAARMDAIESAVADLREETADLTERTDGLERDVAAVSEELQVVAGHVDTLQEQAERTESFFHRLQALLNELFGEAGGQPTPTPDNK